MQIEKAIVHELQKERHQQSTLSERDNELVVDETLSTLVEAIRKKYTTNGKAYGRFKEDQNSYPVSRILNEHLDNTKSFVDFTKEAMGVFKSKIDGQQLATGGYVLFVIYNTNGTRYLIIIMLNDQSGATIDPNTLEINDATHLDLSHLHLAARIDINKWLGNQVEKYLSFVKAKSSTNSVSQYFREFIGCDDFVDSKNETQNLLKIVRDYCQNQDFNSDECINFKQSVFDYCNEKRKSGQPVYLEQLSHALDEDNPDDFLVFANNDNYTLSNVFDIHSNTLVQLKRFKGKDKRLNIAFDSELLGDRIIYNREQGSLTINELPDDLKQQLDEFEL